MRKMMRGVTLTELMVVVVIIGILTMVAYPNYRQYAARAKRNEARAALLQIATNQEKFYLQNNTYTTDMTELGFGSASNYLTSSKSYIVDVTSATPNNFVAQADYQNIDPDENAKCDIYVIDGQGNKTSTPDTDCWTKTR